MTHRHDIRTMHAVPGSEVAVVQAFVRAQARTAASARPLADLGLTVTPTVAGLAQRGLLYRTPGDRWYLDVARYTARQRRRHLVQLGVTAAVVALLVWVVAAAL
jgi:hypothetical protein